MNKIEQLIKERDELQKQIDNYSDGFDYIVCVHSYGNHWVESFKNLYSALELTDEYYQDNGFAHLYTNNTNAPTSLNSGSVYFIKDINSIDANDLMNYNDAILMSEIKNLNNGL